MVRKSRHSNDVTMTLNGTINAAVTSLNVSDGTDLPSTGDFRISIESEIMNVTERSANTLTVERGADGTTPASHATSSPVITIATKASFDDLIRDAFGPNPVWWGTSGEPGPKRMTQNVSDFTWVNQGTSSAVDNSSGSITIKAEASAPHSLRCLTQNCPAGDFDYFCHVRPSFITEQSLSGCHWGIFLRENSTGRLLSVTLRHPVDIGWYKWWSATSFSASYDSFSFKWNPDGMWLYFTRVGTNLWCGVSADGKNYKTLGTAQAQNDFFTTAPDELGIYYANHDGSDDHMCHFRSWLVD